jgi:hypothetical protein
MHFFLIVRFDIRLNLNLTTRNQLESLKNPRKTRRPNVIGSKTACSFILSFLLAAVYLGSQDLCFAAMAE